MVTKLLTQKKVKFLKGIIDVLATLLTFYLAIGITNITKSDYIGMNYEVIIISAIVLITYFTLFNSLETSKIPKLNASNTVLLELFKINTIGALMLLAADIIIRTDHFPAITIVLFTVLNFTILYGIRMLTFRRFHVYRANAYNTRNVIIIGGADSIEIIDKLMNQKEWGYKIVSIVSNSSKIRSLYHRRTRIYPSSINLNSVIQHNVVDDIICYDDVLSPERIEEIAEFCDICGINFRLKTSEKEILYQHETHIQYFDKIPLYTISNDPAERYSYVLKTAFEILASTLIIFMISPFLLIISLIIATSSKGPIIFKQERVGLRGRKFYIYKFREK